MRPPRDDPLSVGGCTGGKMEKETEGSGYNRTSHPEQERRQEGSN